MLKGSRLGGLRTLAGPETGGPEAGPEGGAARESSGGRFGDGEIHYMDLVDEIAKAVPHFISHPVPKRAAGPPPSARNDGEVAVALPPSIAESKDRLRAAVLRAAPKTRAAKGGQPIPPRDLLHGTFLIWGPAPSAGWPS